MQECSWVLFGADNIRGTYNCACCLVNILLVDTHFHFDQIPRRNRSSANSFKGLIIVNTFHRIASGLIHLWELGHKEDWVPTNWCFQIVVLEKTLESPLDCKEIKPVNPKGNQPWIFIGRTNAEAKLQYSGHLMRRADSLEKTLMLGKIEGRRRRGQQRKRGLDSITDTTDMNLSKLQEIAEDRWAGTLQSTRLPRWTRLSN